MTVCPYYRSLLCCDPAYRKPRNPAQAAMTTEPNASGDTATHNEESPADHNRSLADALRSVPIFAELSEADMTTLASAITVQSLEKGEMLFKEGDTGALMA